MPSSRRPTYVPEPVEPDPAMIRVFPREAFASKDSLRAFLRGNPNGITAAPTTPSLPAIRPLAVALSGALYAAQPVSKHKNIRIYESPELMGAFLGVFKDGQARGVLNKEVSAKILLDVFMGIIGRVVLMHIVRREKQPLIDQFDGLFHIVWRALSADEG